MHCDWSSQRPTTGCFFDGLQMAFIDAISRVLFVCELLGDVKRTVNVVCRVVSMQIARVLLRREWDSLPDIEPLLCWRAWFAEDRRRTCSLERRDWMFAASRAREVNAVAQNIETTSGNAGNMSNCDLPRMKPE